VNITLRIQLAHQSLLGVSIGDGFGESFFGEAVTIADHIIHKTIPPTTWQFTDDTIMTIAVFEDLETDGAIDSDRLVKKFCINHDLDPNRGYGATARLILREIDEGTPWQTAAANAFDGQGSMGNGAAMRASPIGAYYYDDLNKIKELAVLSAQVTHAHPEAIEGAVAIAVAAALAARQKKDGIVLLPEEFIAAVAAELQPSVTRSKILKALTIPPSFHTSSLSSILGNGTGMTAPDTVPFVIWCTAHYRHDFEAALWKAVSVLGDRDTICAMVGGITILSAADNTIPQEWRDAVEDADKSIFRHSKENQR
jgi:ADP-ribosylglycohydrolase